MPAVLDCLSQDNEENALVCLRILFEVLKSVKSAAMEVRVGALVCRGVCGVCVTLAPWWVQGGVCGVWPCASFLRVAWTGLLCLRQGGRGSWGGGVCARN
jgi:hypothetical protein